MKEEKSPFVFQGVVALTIVVVCFLLRTLFPTVLLELKEEYNRMVNEIPMLDLSEIKEMAFDYDSLSDFRS